MAWCGDEKPWSFAVLLPPPSGDKDPRTMPSGNWIRGAKKNSPCLSEIAVPRWGTGAPSGWLSISDLRACSYTFLSIWSEAGNFTGINYQDYWAGRQDTFVWGTKSIIATCEATDRGHEEEIKGLALLYYTGGFLRTWCAWIKERAVFGWQPQPVLRTKLEATHTHTLWHLWAAVRFCAAGKASFWLNQVLRFRASS